MASVALDEWRTDRASRITELVDAHASVGGTGMGRRYRTEQLNWSLTLRVAAEFQGFSRSLHDLAVDEIASRTAALNAPVGATLRRIMGTGRKLDMGNPDTKALASDFGKLGMDFWTAIEKRYPAWTQRSQEQLEALLDARNGIAHADAKKIAEIERRGYSLRRLSTVRSWYGWMNRLAGMMDRTVGEYVGDVFGGAAPW